MNIKRVRPVRAERDDQGAVALMVAVLALVLVGVSALAVDLSSAFVQKRTIQSKADFAALAGSLGDDLPTAASGAMCSYGQAAKATDQAIIDAAAYLSQQPGATDITAAQLVNCNLADAEAGFGIFDRDDLLTLIDCAGDVCLVPNKNQLSVISQPETVNFGLAGVFGEEFQSVDVRGEATVEIKTPLMKTLPLYAHSGCDFGSQTIKQPTNGQSSDGVLLDNAGDNNTYIKLDTLAVMPASTTVPPTVAYNSSTATLTLGGVNLDRVNQVGFQRSGSPPPPRVTMTKAVPVVNPNGFSVNGTGTTITLTIPTTVTSVQDVWFVRLYGANKSNLTAPNEWTPVRHNGNPNAETNLAAKPFIVGNATLNCAQGSSDGNFGTLDLFNQSAGATACCTGQDENIAYNIAFGLQYGLAPYPEANWTPPDYQCVDGQDGVAITWESNQDNSGTNCVATQPGLRANAAEAGFVTGVSSTDEALLKNPTNAELCPFDYPTGTTHKATAPTGDLISNDVLTCYFLNDSVTVADVSSATYAGPAVIDQSIYESARFVNVPVLGVQPDEGGSNEYEIIDFRPGFITDQAPTANRTTSSPTAGNGLVWSPADKLQAINVVFLNPKALPEPPLDPTGKYIPYTGSGRKVALLVN